MLKATLLATWRDLSDGKLEEALADRGASFRRFCGFFGQRALSPFAAAFDADQVDAGNVLLDQRMQGRLADKQEMAARSEDGLTHRLIGEQIVAQIDWVEPGIVSTMAG